MRTVRNITVCVSPELYRQTKKLAAEYDTTVTGIVAYLLEQLPHVLVRSRYPVGGTKRQSPTPVPTVKRQSSTPVPTVKRQSSSSMPTGGNERKSSSYIPTVSAARSQVSETDESPQAIAAKELPAAKAGDSPRP